MLFSTAPRRSSGCASGTWSGSSPRSRLPGAEADMAGIRASHSRLRRLHLVPAHRRGGWSRNKFEGVRVRAGLRPRFRVGGGNRIYRRLTVAPRRVLLEDLRVAHVAAQRLDQSVAGLVPNLEDRGALAAAV